MKKFLICINLLGTIPAFAIDCPWGLIMKGNNGAEYCMSKMSLNFFSAYSWCETQGMRLQTMSEICDTTTEKWSGNTGEKLCPNFKDTSNKDPQWCWSATSFKTGINFGASTGSGLVFTSSLNTTAHALCR